MSPRVSIIIPVYNGEKFVRHAITSVNNQQSGSFEIIVVDDGSRDDSVSLIRKTFGDVILLEKSNGGAGSAVSGGLELATGEYVSFCDQDDWWLPEKLVKQVEYLDNHKDIDLVYSDAYIGDENGNISDETWMQTRRVTSCVGGYNECAQKLFRRNFICAPLVVTIRKSALNAVGGVRGKYRGAYDYDLWFRLLERGSRFGYIHEPLAVWRLHSENESGNIRRAKRIQFLILFSFLGRNPMFILQHPILVCVKLSRMLGAFVLNFNPHV